jgi:hypothetical protein
MSAFSLSTIMGVSASVPNAEGTSSLSLTAEQHIADVPEHQLAIHLSLAHHRHAVALCINQGGDTCVGAAEDLNVVVDVTCNAWEKWVRGVGGGGGLGDGSGERIERLIDAMCRQFCINMLLQAFRSIKQGQTCDASTNTHSVFHKPPPPMACVQPAPPPFFACVQQHRAQCAHQS